MRNLTISLDDDTYRRARILAAQQDTSVSALVKHYLVSLASGSPAARDLRGEQEALLDAIWKKHPRFRSAENLSREALHER